jgi:hypothetical protein
MVELRDILPWIIVRQLDVGFYHDWYRLELVAKYIGYLCQSAYILNRHVL